MDEKFTISYIAIYDMEYDIIVYVMTKTVALDAKAYQTLIEYAESKRISIGKAASDLIVSGISGQASSSESSLKCPECGRDMNYIYVGLSPGRYQLFAGCSHCE
ncbi:hypothetical protein ACFLTS_06545 [Chloroflexota bacterium]